MEKPFFIVSPTGSLDNLKKFREEVYQVLGPAKDALFELADAVLLTPSANSFAEFSTNPVFRRKWSSVYEAVQDGRPPRQDLLKLYTARISGQTRPILAGDHTAWSRPYAVRVADRTVEHQPNRIPGAKPITVGWGFSSVVWVPETAGSWALPLLHERISSQETPIEKMIAQLGKVCSLLPERPVALLDAEYGCAPFVNGSAAIKCDKLFRLRPNLCLWGEPVYKGKGRLPIHGAKFKLSDTTTWGTPAKTLEVTDDKLGAVKVSVWEKLHLRKSAKHPMWVIRVERLEAKGTRRNPKVLWLAWFGETPPPLPKWWRLYLRRFTIDHWYRFLKQSLKWTLPHFKTPAQAECWSDLLTIATWELWLAWPVVSEIRLPWQKPQTNLTPGRVRQSFGSILPLIGTPAQEPKPRGKATGWPKGRPRRRAERQPVVKKGKKSPKRQT